MPPIDLTQLNQLNSWLSSLTYVQNANYNGLSYAEISNVVNNNGLFADDAGLLYQYLGNGQSKTAFLNYMKSYGYNTTQVDKWGQLWDSQAAKYNPNIYNSTPKPATPTSGWLKTLYDITGYLGYVAKQATGAGLLKDQNRVIEDPNALLNENPDFLQELQNSYDSRSPFKASAGTASTGLSSTTIIVIIAVLALVIGGGFLLSSGKKNKK
jgi:hypothetical protein